MTYNGIDKLSVFKKKLTNKFNKMEQNNKIIYFLMGFPLILNIL